MSLNLVQPGDPEYPALCSAWNAGIQHRPALILAAQSAEEIAEAVAHASARGLRVRVQATGHGALRPATGDDLLIVTSGMTGVTIEDGTALVQPGTRWKAVLDAAHPHGLAPLLGSTSDVGVIGYSLGGGLGFLARKYGLAADAIVELQLACGDGRLRWIDDTRDPELMGALRGCGPSFGVVTAMRTRLVPAAEVYGGTMFWPAELAREVLLAYRSWVRGVPVELTSAVGVLHVPDLPIVPEPMRGQSFTRICLCHCGPDFSGVEELLAPLRAIPGLVVDMTQPMPSTRMDEITMDPAEPMPFAIRGEMMADLTDEAVDYLASISPRDREPYLLWLTRHVGGMPHRNAGLGWAQGEFVTETISVVPDESLAGVVRAFGDRFSAGLRSAATGYTPLNFVGSPEETGLAFTGQYGTHLAELKKRHDPANLFGGDRPLQTDISSERNPRMM
ncbi:MAG: FAD-binding oxidoreductase [Thermoactinospora sp.]|nr:FAD-binding oxidoreductase [Thermoactinospora sp.]